MEKGEFLFTTRDHNLTQKENIENDSIYWELFHLKKV